MSSAGALFDRCSRAFADRRDLPAGDADIDKTTIGEAAIGQECVDSSLPIPREPFGGCAAEGAERSLDQCRIEPAGDEYQTRAPIPIGPRAQMPRRMHQMLHRMHRHRRCRVGDIEDALDPQQRIAMAVEQHRQPDAEPRPIDRLVEAERQRADIVGVAMMIVGRMIVAICRLPVLSAPSA